MKNLLFCSMLAFILLDCSSKTELVETQTSEGYIERYHRLKQDYAKEGTYTLSTPEGVLLEYASFTKDTLNGTRVLFYESGDTQVVENYAMGIFHGPYKAYYSKNNLEIEGAYVDNQMEGIWKRYYDTGELMESVSFQGNQENGPFVEYFKNGKLKAEGTYLNGDNEHGELKLYNEKGELIRKMNCDKGICRTSWTLEPDTQSEI